MLKTTNGDPVINAILADIKPTINKKPTIINKKPKKYTYSKRTPKVNMSMTSSKTKLENIYKIKNK